MAVALFIPTGCHALRGEHGLAHKGAVRVVPLGGTVSPPKNRSMFVRFIEVSPDGKSARFQVQSRGESYEGWVVEGQSLGSFAQPLVGNSGLSLTKLTPDEPTLFFMWAEPF